MSDSSDDYLIVYRRFFNNFALSVDVTDQLPVKVAGYNLTKFEIPGAVTDWCIQYLNLRQCPPNLIVPLIRLVLEEMNQMIEKQPEACGYRPSEDDYFSLRLMQVTMRKLVEVCSQYKDNAQLLTLPSPKVGLFAPLTSMCAVKNSRRSMEDRHIIIQDFHALHNIEGCGAASYYGVFDGHNGLDAAVYSVANLHQYLADSNYYPTDPVNAFKDAFRKTDTHFICKSEKEHLQSGTTAVCALLRPKENMLYVAWLGDSQAVLVRKGHPFQLVTPHKPERMDEKQRIEDMGGTVLYWGMWRVNGQLAVSRAIGDVKYKPYVSAEPDVKSIQLDGTEDLLILACDGLWDYVSEPEATDAIYEHLSQCPGDVEGVSQRLVALSKEQGSTDNISVVVVFLAEPSEVTQRRYMETASPNPFHKQNGADLFCGGPTNGKLRSCTTAAYDDEDDFGPETDVDMVDDVLLSPAIAAAKALVAGKKDYDDDLERQRQQLSDFDDPADIDRSRDTPTPPAHEVAGNADVDNLTESGDGEDSEEDEWNFIPGSGENKKEEKSQEEEDDDMSSQLNPNAAEFVPISPTKRTVPEDSDTEVSSSSLCFKQSFDNVSIPTRQEFFAEISTCPGQFDHINGQNDHPVENVFNDSSIIVAHHTLEDSNILSTKAEFGDSSNFETSMNTSNPFSIKDLLEDDQASENINPFTSSNNSNSFDIQNLIGSASSEVDTASNHEPVRNIKEFKTFAECVAEPKKTATTPESDDNIIPGTPRSTIVEAPVSPSSDVYPIPQQEDIESPDDYLANVSKSPELLSPSEEPHDMYTGQEPTSSSGFDSESGAEETEPNVIAESNLADDGFVVETKRLSPPIQTLTFKPIETFGDKNPFGLLENPSPIYKPQASNETYGIQSLDDNKEVVANLISDASHLESEDLHTTSNEPYEEGEIVAEHPAKIESLVDIHSENLLDISEEMASQVSQDLGLKQDKFAFGGLDSEIKANEFIFGAGSSEVEEAQTKCAPFSSENEESKIRLDEQESEQEIETKDAAFGVDLKQEAIDTITSVFDTNFVDFSTEQTKYNPFEENKQRGEYEAKESDFQFDPTDVKSDYAPDGFRSKDQSFDMSKEISNLQEDEKESDTAIENMVSEDIVSSVNASFVESPITGQNDIVQETANIKKELKLNLSDNPVIPKEHGSVSPSPKKDSSPLSPKAQPFVPTRVPVEEPLCKKVILEKKYTEPSESEDGKEGILCDFEEQNELNISSPQDSISSLIPKLDLDTQICLSEPEIHEVREGINEIIKEAEKISNLSSSEDILQNNTVSSVVERLALESVSEVLENELIVQSTEPGPESSLPLITEKQPLSPDQLNIVQEKDVLTEKEQISSDVNEQTAVQHAVETLDVTVSKDVEEVPSTTGTPPTTPAPGLVEEQEGMKEGILAAAAAVAAAGAVAVVAIAAADKGDLKKSATIAVKKTTQVAAKKPVDANAKTASKPVTATTKPTAKPTATKSIATEPKKPTTVATTKPLVKSIVASKPANFAAKTAPKPSTAISKTNPSASKPTTVKSTATGGSKSATPSSKPATPISKPSTPTTHRPSISNKTDSGKASPTKTVTSTKTIAPVPKPQAKVPPIKLTEKKPLTNGDVSKSTATNKPEVSAIKKTTTTTAATKPPPITRPSSATTKASLVTSKTTTSTASSKLPSVAPKSTVSAPKPKPAAPTAKTAAKPAVGSTVPKRPASAVTATKSIDKTGKDNVNKQISSEKTGSKPLASKTATKKTEVKSAGSGKPKPVTKPAVDITKVESKEKVGPTQEGSITTTNGYGGILENGIKKDDSPLDNSHQDIMEAIN